MKIVIREVDRLDHLITDFLDYARPLPRRVRLFDIQSSCSEYWTPRNVRRWWGVTPCCSIPLR